MTPTRRHRRRRSSIRCSAPARSGTRAGRRRPRSRQLPSRGVTSTCRSGSSSTPRPTRANAPTWRRSTPRSCRSSTALWWTEAGPAPSAPARVPWRDRDPGNRATTAHGAEVPVRLLPGRSRDPGVGRPQHPQPVLHDRGRGGDRHGRGRRRARLPGLPVRRSRAVREGRQAQVRLQLRGRAGAGRRVQRTRPDRPRRPLRHVRQGGGRDAHERHAHAAHPGQGGRLCEPSGPNRASSDSAAAGWSSGDPEPSR